MRKFSLFLFAALLASAFSSCVILSTKKHKSLLATQDSLNRGWNESQLMNENLESLIAKLRKDTTGLSTALNDLRGRYTEMDSNYSTLRSNSSTEINRL